MKNEIRHIILTSMTDLCRYMQKDDIVIVSMKPIKGIADEDIMKVGYIYKK